MTDNPYVKLSKKGFYYVDIEAVVKKILSTAKFVTIYGRKNEEIWYYDKETYSLRGREAISVFVEHMLGSWSKTKDVNEIINKIKRKTQKDREEFESVPVELLPLKNGVLNLKTKELLSYKPEYYFKTKINVKYDKKAKCPLWDKFVKETFYEDDVLIVQEWFGFSLYRDYFLKKGFIGIGDGDSGKSVFQNVLLKFFGEENVSGLSLQKLVGNNNFNKANLKNKYVNLYDDMSASDINEGGGFKMVTGKSPITAEYKFGDQFQFINYAKMTFCCNKIPPIKDTEDLTYYNRWLPIRFDNVVPVDQQDKFLIAKLTTEEELSGILLWALEGLERLLKNGKFSYTKTAIETKILMDRSSHPLSEFVLDCLQESKEHAITKEVMYEVYSLWAKENNKSRLTKERLGRTLPLFANFIIDGRSKVRYWKNVKFKDNDNIDAILEHISNPYYYYSAMKNEDEKESKVSKDWEDSTPEAERVYSQQELNHTREKQ